MKFIADFHIHSKYSRATSPQMVLPELDRVAKIKGIALLGSGDFTHPQWLEHLKENLEPAEQGLYRLKSQIPNPNDQSNSKSQIPNAKQETRFILTSEISCIYSKSGKVRKIHILVLAPDIASVETINQKLGFIGNLRSDGRPILGLDAKELAKIVLNINPECLVVPCHAWTPWFSVFGSKSGFDSLEECFEDYAKYIYAIETGLSSDPEMNWRISALDKITLISNSDAHSPAKLGREANVFDAELNYSAIAEAIKTKDPKKFLYTIEFFPEEGKYHFDGHRLCNVVFSPEETKKNNGICPVCQRPLTVGVLNRVSELADRGQGFKPESAIPFKRLVPLEEIISEVLEVGAGTKEVLKEYGNLIGKLGSEIDILLNTAPSELFSATLPEIAEAIWRARQGEVSLEPGYDGVYGKVKIFKNKEDKKGVSSQKALF